MALKTETRDIDGLTVTSTQLPAMRSFALMARLGKVIAPALGMVEGVSLTSGIGALAPALAQLFAQLDGAEAESLAREVLASTSVVVDGRRLELSRTEMINLAFEGRIKTMLATLKFALEVNYGDFFAGGLSGAAAPAPSPPAPASA